MALYNLSGLTRVPMAARISLPCERSRMTIRSVRMTFNETEIEKYGALNLIMSAELMMLLSGSEVDQTARTPVPVSTGLVRR